MTSELSSILKSIAARHSSDAGRDEAFDGLVRLGRTAGFDDVSFLWGQAIAAPDMQAGFRVHEIKHLSSCDDVWLQNLTRECGFDDDYDFVRILQGERAPFLSGLKFVEQLGELSQDQYNILKLKAEAGFSANLVIPIAASPVIGPATSAVVFLSDRPAHHILQAISGDFMSLHSGALMAASSLLKFLHVDQTVQKHAVSELPERRGALTKRQSLVLEKVAQDLKPAEVAQQLRISKSTVEFHLAGARQALNVRTTAAAVARALRLGLLDT